MVKILNDENEDGFTLIEILVVIAIIGVLAAIAVPVYLNQKQVAIDATLQSDIKQMVNSQMDYIANGGKVHGSTFAIRPNTSENADWNATHNTDGLTFIPSPGNYIRTPYINNGEIVGICIIAWSPSSRKHPTEFEGLAWSSIHNYDVTPTNCATKS